jgi:hypothetical protein
MDNTEKTSHVIPSQRVYWRADYCLATSYDIRPVRHIFHCCTLERVYRAVAWKRFEQIRYNIYLPIRAMSCPSRPPDGAVCEARH